MALERKGQEVNQLQGDVSGSMENARATINVGGEIANQGQMIKKTGAMNLSLLDRLNSFSESVLAIGTAQQVAGAKDTALDDVMSGAYVPRNDQSPYAEVYNKIGNEAYVATAKDRLNKTTLANYEKYNGDPEKFLLENAKSTHDEIIKAPSKDLQFILSQSAESTTAAFTKNLTDARIDLNIKRETIGVKNNIAANTGILISQMGKGMDPKDSIEKIRTAYQVLEAKGLSDPQGTDQAIVEIVKKGQREFYLNTASSMGIEGAKNYLKSIEFDDAYTADEKVEIRNSIKSEINSREIAKSEAELTQVKLNNELVQENIKILESGTAPSEPLNPNMTVSPKLRKDYSIAANNYNALIDMKSKPIAEQAEMINAIDTSTVEGLEQKQYLEKQHKKFVLGNLMETAQDFKMIDNTFVNASTDIIGLKKREMYQDALTEKYGKQAEFLTPSEQDNMKNWYATSSVADKLTFLNNVKELKNSGKVLSEISKNTSGVLAFSGELLDTKNVAVAQLVLTGDQLDNEPPPKLKNEVSMSLGDIIGRASANDFNAYQSAAVNYAKAKLASGIVVSPQEAIEATSGKIATYNGRKIFLPMNVSKDTFDNYLKTYTNKNESLQNDIRGLANFFDGSVQLHYVGRGKYQVYYPNLGSYASEKDTNGKLKPVELNYGSK